MDEEKIVNMLISLTQTMANIQGDIRVIKHELEADYKALYGNGKAGILERVETIERELHAQRGAWRIIREWLGWLFALANFLAAFYFSGKHTLS